MRDIEIWAELQGRSAAEPERSVEALLAALEPLGRAAMRQRAGLLGLAVQHRQHANPRVRAGVVAALRGTTGIEGLRVLVAALDDDDATVRAAAVDALKASAQSGQELRLAHALFHPRADVRQRVIADLPYALTWLAAYLRADSVCAAEARAMPLRCGPRLAFELHERGLATDAELCGVLAGSDHVALDQLVPLMNYGLRRTKAELDEVHRWLNEGGPRPGSRDAFDQLVAAVDASGSVSAAAALFRILAEDAEPRLVASIVLHLLARGRVSNALLGAAVRRDPSILAAERLSLVDRRHAARLYARELPRPPSDPKLGKRLLDGDLVRDGDSGLDLRVAASVAWLLDEPRHSHLVATLGLGSVLAALTRADKVALDGMLALCELTPASRSRGKSGAVATHAYNSPLDLIAAAPAEVRPRLRAAALAGWASQGPRLRHLIDSMSEAERCESAAILAVELDGALVELDDRDTQRLAGRLAEAIGGHGFELVGQVLNADRLRPLGAALVERILREAPPIKLALLVAASEPVCLVRLAAWIHEGITLPVQVEQQLGGLLRGHAAAEVRAAADVLGTVWARVEDRSVVETVHALTHAEAEAIASCAFAKLGNALDPALTQPSRRLSAALGRRTDPKPSLEACVALLAAHDPITMVGERFGDYFDHDDPEFGPALTAAAVTMWQRNPGLPPLGNAWLNNFEQHALGFAAWLVGEPGGLISTLMRGVGLPLPLRVRWFEAAAHVFALWRYREPGRLASLELDGLATDLVEQLDTELGPPAAKLLVTLHLGGTCTLELARLQPRVWLMAPDLDRVTRHELHRWLRIDGLPGRDAGARAEQGAIAGGLLERLRVSDDLEFLAEWCRSPNRVVVEEAVLRLLEFGEAGEARLVLALAESIAPVCFDVLVTSVAMWTSHASVDDVRALASDPELGLELRFRIALALAERGEQAQVDVGVAILREGERSPGWLRAHDWLRLTRLRPEAELALSLADSPHPHAYQRATTWLLAQPSGDARVVLALRGFLATGTERPRHLRLQAATRLLAAGDLSVVPVLLAELTDPDSREPPLEWVAKLPPEPRATVLDAAVSAALIGGAMACTQLRIASLLDVPGLAEPGPIAREAFDRALRRLFLDSTDDHVRSQLALRASSPQWRRTKLQGIAEIFAWGVRRGRELTGRLFRVHMTDKRQDFGYTLLDEDRIFVTPLPYFAGERHGREIVEGLILHEFGHHMFHRGDEAAKIWRTAQDRGLHGVLNLVADEHLERNLRSLRADYGDRLKRLGAHAFLHAERDRPWKWLLQQLGASSFAILSARPTAPAHALGELRVSRGELLQALEAGGSSWARFARALRMGLGDRWDDPKVRAGLELFKGRFRHADMAELWRISLELARLFADEIPLAGVCGGHETLADAEREGAVARGGIGDEELQEEIERILDPRQLRSGEARSKPSRKLAINVGPDERFDLITDIRRLQRDAEAHRKRAREIARHSTRLRGYLSELGLGLVPRRARLQGRSFDRTRVQAVVLRNDPRMLVARELEIQSDLFIGVLIDCSASMAVRELLAKACSFAVLLAEAVRGLPGVDAQFWGFNDSTIWDAGDADRCAVTSLETSGGNNDAAALLHAAQAAAGSRRKAKLLVMISDGLPTQCSVAALRNLVLQLGRRQRIVCAQVAVRPLEEVCFPHHVLLADEPIELATVRFGELVSKLARRALGR